MNALFALAALGFAQEPGVDLSFDDFITTDNHAYMVLPPQAVGSPQTVYMSWSPSGRYLLIGSMKPRLTPAFFAALMQGNRAPEPSLIVSVFVKQTGKTVEMGTLPQYRPQKIRGLRWMKERDVAMDLVVEPIGKDPVTATVLERSSILRLDAASGHLNLLPLANPIPEGVFYRLEVSPFEAKAIVIETKFVPKDPNAGRVQTFSSTDLWTIDERGRATGRSPTGAGAVGDVEWTATGSAWLHFSYASEGRVVREQRSYDLKSGKVSTPPVKPTLFKSVVARSPLEILRHSAESSGGVVKQTHSSAWLKSTSPSELPEYLLSPRVDEAALNSTFDAVALNEKGVITVRLLVQTTLEMYRAVKEAAEKAQAVSNAKQVATAAHIFAADNEDRLPTQEEFASGSLGPYLKNSSISKGFVYAFKGGSINSLENPAGTVLGYIPVAGGYVVAYADGHVKWSKELPKT